MRRIAMLMLGAVIASANFAHAAVEGESKGLPWKFSCRYLAAGEKKEGVLGQCTAYAKVCHYNDGSAPMAAGHCYDKLAVACDGAPVYRDGAAHTSTGGYEFLSGAGGNPVLKYPSERPEGDSFVVSSWLKVGERLLEGFCAVERKELNGVE